MFLMTISRDLYAAHIAELLLPQPMKRKPFRSMELLDIVQFGIHTMDITHWPMPTGHYGNPALHIERTLQTPSHCHFTETSQSEQAKIQNVFTHLPLNNLTDHRSIGCSAEWWSLANSYQRSM